MVHVDGTQSQRAARQSRGAGHLAGVRPLWLSALQVGFVYCPNCGMSLWSAACPSCGQAVDPAWKFCPFCGAALSATVPVMAGHAHHE